LLFKKIIQFLAKLEKKEAWTVLNFAIIMVFLI